MNKNKKNSKCWNIKECLNREFSTISGILIVLSVVAVLGGIIIWQINCKPLLNPDLIFSSDSALIPSPSIASITPTDENAGWKVYSNESYGIRFEYPPTYDIVDEDDLISPGKIDQILILEDSREGNPVITILFNPDGIGGVCMYDIDYETEIKNGKLSIVSRDESDSLDCMRKFVTLTEFELDDWIKKYYKNKEIWVHIGYHPRWSYDEEIYSKNSIIVVFNFERERFDYEEELLQIMETLTFEKEEIFGFNPQL